MAEDNGQAGNQNVTQEQAVKRGPGRPPKPLAGADVQKTELVTYLPGDGDPHTVKWGGHTFHANVATPVAYVDFADPEAAPHPNKTLVERARGNKHFKVGDEKKPAAGPAQPTTPEQYRAHVVAWLKDIGRDAVNSNAMTAGCTEALIRRWADDAKLREVCGVGTDDYIYLRSLIDPKLSECQRADELNNEQLRELWVKHGIMELPWRV